MIQIIIFFIFTVLNIALLAGIAILAIYRIIALIRKKANPKQLIRMKKTSACLALVMILNGGLMALTQITASTPRIVDKNGHTPPNSIAELVQVELNGRKQWISLRGWDESKPVLLFLAGGPGGTQMAAVRHELGALEQHFVVVNWDQPGSGKSYYAEKQETLPLKPTFRTVMP